ncbi:MAG: divergent polysaccharide deacetylase family protein [Candidatus Omnitrophota bacterium]|nr:divergent polysaccharide deacetylase family protein [Candidatus Omnitrophota bacterium]
MKTKMILMVSAAIFLALLLAIGFIHWRSVQARKGPPAKTRFVRQAVKRKRQLPPPAAVKRANLPKIAIVIDDFGYNKNNIEELFGINIPVTLSVLPGLRYSSEIALLSRSRGCEVILHLPLEARNKEVREEADTIKTGMSEEDVAKTLDKAMASVPGLSGVSNHMGSKATEDKALMSIVFKRLKSRGLYFFDSLTSDRSVCRQVAGSIGLRYARRDIFLDNSNAPAGIEKELLSLRKRALRYGRAIAICHDRKNTITALAKAMPDMARNGIEFVPLSEMVR